MHLGSMAFSRGPDADRMSTSQCSSMLMPCRYAGMWLTDTASPVALLESGITDSRFG